MCKTLVRAKVAQSGLIRNGLPSDFLYVGRRDAGLGRSSWGLLIEVRCLSFAGVRQHLLLRRLHNARFTGLANQKLEKKSGVHV